MNYELKTLYRIVAGDLNPSKDEKDKFDKHICLLQKYYQECVRHIRINFSKTLSGQHHLTGFQDYALLENGYVLALDNRLQTADSDLQQQLITLAVSILKILYEDIKESSVKVYQDHVSLELIIKQEFKLLNRNQATYYYYQLILSREVERIKHVLNEKVFKLRSEKEIKLYIQNYQHTLEKFSTLTASYLPESERENLYQLSAAYQLYDVYKVIYRHIDNLRTYLESHFTKYIDVYGAVTYQSRIGSAMAVRKRIKSIYIKLNENSIDPQLIKILHNILRKFAYLVKQPGCTYNELVYFRMLIKNLCDTFQQEGNLLSTQTIVDLLLRLNFNAVPFLNYLIKGIEEERDKKKEPEDKLTLLYYYHKLYKQRLSRTNTAFHKSLPNLKDQLVLWLEEEIKYCKKIERMNQQVEKKYDELPEQFVKLKTSLSVSHLAYLLKVMHQAGIISNENQRDIARFASECISTEKTSKISYESLYSKYYNVETSTHKAVREVILKMLNYINQHKL